MTKIEQDTCIKFEQKSKNNHQERVLMINVFRQIETDMTFTVSAEIKPGIRTTLNFVMESVVIPLLDEKVEDNTLFCHHIVPRNTLLSTRFISFLLEY